MTAQLYRRRPAIVRAVRFDGSNLSECSQLVGPAVIRHDPGDPPMTWMSIDAPDHYATVMALEWLVKHDDGRFDVFPPEAFERAYEPIGGDQ